MSDVIYKFPELREQMIEKGLIDRVRGAVNRLTTPRKSRGSYKVDPAEYERTRKKLAERGIKINPMREPSEGA